MVEATNIERRFAADLMKGAVAPVTGGGTGMGRVRQTSFPRGDGGFCGRCYGRCAPFSIPQRDLALVLSNGYVEFL
jgi:hypothetical protein